MALELHTRTSVMFRLHTAPSINAFVEKESLAKGGGSVKGPAWKVHISTEQALKIPCEMSPLSIEGAHMRHGTQTVYRVHAS